MLLSRSQVWRLTVSFWTVFGAVCGMQIWLSMKAHGHSLPRIVFHQVAVWDAWILIGLVVGAFARRVPLVPLATRRVLVHLLLGCATGLVHAAWWSALTLVIRPYDRMNPTTFSGPFAETAFYQMPLELLLYVAVVLFTHGNDGYALARSREIQGAQLERSLAEARLKALELQIQPHFLFNTLNAISALVRTGKTADAVAMISGLSDLFRYVLIRSGGERVSVDDEAEMLRRYLEIQRLRFPDRLSFEIDVAQDAHRAAIPVLLLQPLAENAVRHVIAPEVGPGRVHVRVFRREGELWIEIHNTGRLDARFTYGIGLSNTVSRLEQLYGDQQRFELRQSGDGVLARVTLPWTEVA